MKLNLEPLDHGVDSVARVANTIPKSSEDILLECLVYEEGPGQIFTI